jgi:tight adherence protein C
MTATLPSGFPVVVFMMTLFMSWHLIPRIINQWDEKHHAPIPIKIKLMWPCIIVISAFIHWTDIVLRKKRVTQHLRQSGIGRYLSPEQFVALKICHALSGLFLALLVVNQFGPSFNGLKPFAMAIGFHAPTLWMNKTRQTRQQAIIKDLSSVTEFLRIALVSGLNFSGAIQQVIKKGPNGPLKQEFSDVIKDMRTGQSRISALQNSMHRVEIAEYSTLIQSIIQAETSGASLTDSLKNQAEQRRNERFYRAEKAALQAPVKLIFPLVVFIFPVSFLILFFPIVIRFTQGM